MFRRIKSIMSWPVSVSGEIGERVRARPEQPWRRIHTVYDRLLFPRLKRILKDLPDHYSFGTDQESLIIHSEGYHQRLNYNFYGSAIMSAADLAILTTTDDRSRITDLSASLAVYDFEDISYAQGGEPGKYFSLHGKENTLGLGVVLRGVKQARDFIEAHPDGCQT